MNEVIKALVERRSCKRFRSEQVKEEQLQEILKAGTYAANGRGRQAAKIVVVQDPQALAQLERMNADILGAPELRPFYGAPTVCVILARREVYTGVEDGSLVIGNMMAAAWSLGVGSCWIHRAREEFESPEGKALLQSWGIEGDYIGVGHCILGYPEGEYAPAAPRKEDYVTRV